MLARRTRAVAVTAGCALVLLAASLTACGDGGSEGGADGGGDRGGAAEPAPGDDTTDPTGDPTDETAGDGAERPAGTLEWRRCDDDECAELDVPLDHDGAGAETITLALARRRAGSDDGRIGVLLVNPGGPGADVLGLLDVVEDYVGEELLDRFDVVVWDPRGVGESTPVDCTDDLDPFFAVDRSPDDDAELAANIAVAEDLAAGCEARSGELLAHVSTTQTVRDLDTIRAALGEERITYLGFSYGTLIGALYADEYPGRVRAMVLDGAVDPTLSFEQSAVDQARGFDAALGAFFAECEREPCGFGGADPAAAYDSLMAQIDAEVLPAFIAGEERELGPGEADIGVAAALYAGRDGWSVLADALTEAAQGDGSALLALTDAYTSRSPGGEFTNAHEAFYAISCLDAPAPATAGELAAMADRVQAVAPRFGAATVWLGSPCTVWPVPPDREPGPVRAETAPPIVVLGTSNDPATPLHWAEALADQLTSGVLVVLDDEGHTAYGRGNECVDDAVERYVLDGTVPAAGTRC